MKSGTFLAIIFTVPLCFSEQPKAVWDFEKAFRETTPTRERVCLNGLWRWQPAKAADEPVPADRWGFFKVPGPWPGITSYIQKDCQTVHPHPDWQNEKLRTLTAAWYQREITIPRHWSGRRIALAVEYLNSRAIVYLDDKKVGELRFPAGELDITTACRPGSKHLLSLRVEAKPLHEVLLSYTDTGAARTVKGDVTRRGLCGDVWLVSTPPGPRIGTVKISTSTRRDTITFDAAVENVPDRGAYRLQARIFEGNRPVAAFEGGIPLTANWKPDKLWDLHTPQNIYQAQVTLLDATGRLLDVAWPERFGFREFWIDGRDFYLNGSRIWLSAVPVDNAQLGAAWASYTAARESLLRLKSFGINFVYTHNYDCLPGSHLSFAELLNAADDVGMLVALSQPHFSHYDWQMPDADQRNGYAQHAAFYVRVAGNHPSVVFYSMSHNATGYSEDMNPHLMDGRTDPRDKRALVNVERARRAEAIVKQLDPDRIVYHHSSGNLGAMHTSNFYANFTPIQEMSDWFEHWATNGVKPLFTCEYGVPFTWDWAMYRGWYKGQRAFGRAQVPWEFCHAEWNAQFLGDRAFKICEAEKANLRWEAKQLRAGKVWFRWDYPYHLNSSEFEDRYLVFAMYLTDNWRAFRTWGLSANSPWEFGHFWKLRSGISRNARTALPTDWDNLQRPGFSPDYLEQRYERMDLAYERTDWIATPAAEALIRNNRPLLAYIAGKPARFTSKDHIFRPGEIVEKQIIVINNSRQTIGCECIWNFGNQRITLPTGQIARIPIRFEAKPDLTELKLTAKFSTGEVQTDSFALHILPPAKPTPLPGKIAVFDPKGETWAMLKQGQRIEANTDLAGYDILIIGKAADTIPDLRRVRDGLKVIIFEQTPQTLEKHFGFRVTEYGLRQVFKRVPDHPILAGLQTEHLRDWRGEATLLPPRLSYTLRPMHGPTVKWCGLDVTRAWRCGNRGNVASVLIEKPARGDFLPILDGGYSLQYSPLLEHRIGNGVILFCQLDVTGRTEPEPAAENLVRNLLGYVSAWKPTPLRKAFYTGDPAGKRHLETAGFTLHRGTPSPNDVLIVGPGGSATATNTAGKILAIAVEDAPFAPVTITKAEHIAAYFEPFEMHSPFAGVSPADVHNRDPRPIPLVNGSVLAHTGNVVFCQLAPWQFDPTKQINLKRTFRRTSFLLTRILCNLGVPSSTDGGLYLDTPEEMDDPYRFFRW
ncbi:MAG: hypothetical protein N3B01_07400 [Verrucomicrobiae bacterium]|nr:hypothetical protein [Verrucomicrobiae bacterium]